MEVVNMTTWICKKCGKEYDNPRCRLSKCPNCGAPKDQHEKKK